VLFHGGCCYGTCRSPPPTVVLTQTNMLSCKWFYPLLRWACCSIHAAIFTIPRYYRFQPFIHVNPLLLTLATRCVLLTYLRLFQRWSTEPKKRVFLKCGFIMVAPVCKGQTQHPPELEACKLGPHALIARGVDPVFRYQSTISHHPLTQSLPFFAWRCFEHK